MRENRNRILPVRGAGRQALGWVVVYRWTHPGALHHPSREGTFSGEIAQLIK